MWWKVTTSASISSTSTVATRELVNNNNVLFPPKKGFDDYEGEAWSENDRLNQTFKSIYYEYHCLKLFHSFVGPEQLLTEEGGYQRTKKVKITFQQPLETDEREKRNEFTSKVPAILWLWTGRASHQVYDILRASTHRLKVGGYWFRYSGEICIHFWNQLFSLRFSCIISTGLGETHFENGLVCF